MNPKELAFLNSSNPNFDFRGHGFKRGIDFTIDNEKCAGLPCTVVGIINGK